MAKTLFNPATADISEEGLRLRNLYYELQRRIGNIPNAGKYVVAAFDGGVSATGRKYKSNVWDKLHKKLTELRIDSELFLEYVLSHVREIPSPNMLTAENYVSAYKSQLEAQGTPQLWDLEEKKLLTQISILLSLYTDQQKVFARVINDDLIGVSPLVRYAFAVQHNCDFLATERTKQNAFNQYYRKRFFYEKFYADRLPSAFTQN